MAELYGLDSMNTAKKSNTEHIAMEVTFAEQKTNGPGKKEMELINKILSDSKSSPSMYHNPRQIESNIPNASLARPLSARRAHNYDLKKSMGELVFNFIYLIVSDKKLYDPQKVTVL